MSGASPGRAQPRGRALLCVALALGLLPAAAHGEPDPGTATTLSVLSTFVPCALGAAAFTGDAPESGWVLMAAGVLLGPATGYVYGKLPGRGLAGVGIRAGAAVVGMLGVASMFDEYNDSWGGAVIALAAGAGSAVSMAVDVGSVGRDVRRRNERVGFTVTPWRTREGAPGLALQARF